MGFLAEGNVLSWEQAKEYADYIRREGIKQFLHIFNVTKARDNDSLTWGDEVEYLLVIFDNEKKTAKLSLRGHELLEILQQEEVNDPKNAKAFWRPEYGRFMLEGTPSKPYMCIPDIHLVEGSMQYRRKAAKELLKENEHIFSITNFPLLGVGDFTNPSPPDDWTPGSSPFTNSLYIQDQIINPHPRFPYLSYNIRKRRTTTVDINVPLFMDKNTKPQYGTVPSSDPTPFMLNPPNPRVLPNCIYMDAMAFGMGCCCLQCTYHTKNLSEARYIYDQFLVLSPIMLALTAGAPIFRGFLADTDVRWNVISNAVDDRTLQERGLEPVTDAKFVFSKPRYASASLFISSDIPNIDYLNDINAPINKDAYNQLIEGGVDSVLATHIAHLFIRDPLIIYDNKIEIDPTTHSDHFENIQSTNWQTVRFKPPPANSDMGWRVEFRPMEVHLTDFENAAFVVFVKLLYHTFIRYSSQLYMPISKVDENMARAHKAGAVINQKFFFPSSISKGGDHSLVELTINEIINGKEGGFEGLIPLVNQFLVDTQAEQKTLELTSKYFDLIRKRASGELQTTAAWMRTFVLNHPAYKHDSIVSSEINYDLLVTCNKISEGALIVPELLGSSL